MKTLATKGWKAGISRALIPGDYVQVGSRMYRNLNPVNPDVNGKATLKIWPSLREVPTDGAAVILNSPRGLFRRANNEQTWSATVGQMTSLSFQIMEWRGGQSTVPSSNIINAPNVGIVLTDTATSAPFLLSIASGQIAVTAAGSTPIVGAPQEYSVQDLTTGTTHTITITNGQAVVS